MRVKTSFKKWLSESSVQGKLAGGAVGSGVEAGKAGYGAIQGVASLASGNVFAIFDAFKNCYEFFKSFADMGNTARELSSVMRFKSDLHEALSANSLPADKIVEIIFNVDDSVAELLSPALVRATLSKFVANLSMRNPVESMTFAAAIAEAAREVYGAAQRSAEAAKQKVDQLIKQAMPQEMQAKVVQAIGQAQGETKGGDDVPEAQPAEEYDRLFVQARKLNLIAKDDPLLKYIRAGKGDQITRELNFRIQNWGQARKVPEQGDPAYTEYKGNWYIGKLSTGEIPMDAPTRWVGLLVPERPSVAGFSDPGNLGYIRVRGDVKWSPEHKAWMVEGP